MSPINKGCKPCKLLILFTPDCSQLSFTIKKTKCLPCKTINLTGSDRPMPFSLKDLTKTITNVVAEELTQAILIRKPFSIALTIFF